MAKDNIEIFIVDDDQLYLKMIELQFTKNTRYKVNLFMDGDEFINAYRKRDKTKYIPVVILDYLLATKDNLTARDGLHILEEVKNADKNANVIMLSGLPDVNVATKAIKLGATNYIPKNENSFIRIHHTIQYLLSERKVNKRKRQSRHTLVLFVLLLFIALIGLLVTYLKYPGWYEYGVF